MKTHRQLSTAFAILLAAAHPVVAAPTLTGVSTHGTDSSGVYDHTYWYDTAPASAPFSSHNIYIRSGSLSGTLLNGPTDALVAPNIPLSGASMTFWFVSELQGVQGPDHIGLNLYFDGNTDPGISVFGPTLGSVGAPHSFSPNPNSPVPTRWPDTGPSANSSLYVSPGYQVQLLDFAWFYPSVYGVDQTDQYDFGANGLADGVGVITLQITPVPEPTMPALLLAAAAGLILRRGYPRRVG